VVIVSIKDVIFTGTDSAASAVEGAWSRDDIEDDSRNVLKVIYWLAVETKVDRSGLYSLVEVKIRYATSSSKAEEISSPDDRHH